MRVKNVEVSVFNINKGRFMFFSLLSLFFFMTSCKPEMKDNSDRFKKGVFEIPSDKSYTKTTIKRIDSLQIEEYEKIVSITNDGISSEKRIKHIDTLYIKWKNNFFYTLKMKSPKTELDNDPIYVQITKVTDSSYTFTAKIGFSKFATDGVIYKIK